MKNSNSNIRFWTFLVFLPVFVFTAFEQCNHHDPISRIVLTLSSNLTNLIEGSENLLLSPFSISAALAMLYIGTHGTTRHEMKNVLNYNIISDRNLTTVFKDAIGNLRNDASYSVLVSNSVFIQKGYNVSSKYTQELSEFFDSELNYTDFSHDATGTMNAINWYVSNKTRGHIKTILNEPLDPMTVMILMNVIHFKGVWKYPFDKSRSRISLFYFPDGAVTHAWYMFQQNDFYFYYDQRSEISYLEMDYESGNITMILALHDNRLKVPNIASVEDIICRIKPQMEIRNIQVAIPKFKVEFNRELSKDMMALGMRELFSEKADLTGIREGNDLHVSLMIHKAVIEVDEKGSTASAVSGVGIYGRVKNQKPEKFWANHCFIFYIIDKTNDVILFTGRVSNPV